MSGGLGAVGEDSVHRYRWVVLGLAWLSYMSIYIVKLTVPPLSPFIIQDLDLSRLEVGLLVSAVAVGYTAMQMPSGWLIDRIGVRKVLFAGTFAAGASVVGMFFVNSFEAAIAVLFLSGLGCGCFPTVATSAIISWFPLCQRATAIGINQTSVNVAGIITAATLPTLGIVAGWRYGFIGVGLASMVMAAVAYTLYRDPPSSVNVSKASQRKAPQTWRMVREVLLSRDILLVSFSCMGLAIVEFSLTTYLVIYLKEAIGVSVALAGGLLALANTGGGFGKPFFGILSDRVFGGSRKKPLLLVGAMMFVFSILVQVVSQSMSYWILATVFTLFGFTAIGWGGLNQVLVSEFADKEMRGLAMGYSVMIALLGNIVGPPLFGWIADTTGSYSLAWWFLTASALMSMLLMALVQESKRRNID